MSTTSSETQAYPAEVFVESAGAVLFRLQTREICLLFRHKKKEYLLAKGRRNCGEHRKDTAIREVTEETGIACRQLPLNMATRCPPSDEPEQLRDKARQYEGLCEPFYLQIRPLADGGVKLVWWYAAEVDEARFGHESVAEHQFVAEFHGFAEAVEKLTFPADQAVARRAIDLVQATYPHAA